MAFITVVIVNWNGYKFIAKCLDGLKKQTYKDYSILLVDNASEDGSLEFVQNNYPEVQTFALRDNMGFAAANNIAIESVDTEYVALLNNDAVPHPEWLETLKKALDDHPEAGFAASKMLLSDKPNIIDRAGDVFTTSGTALLRGRGEPSANFNNQEWVFGACAGAGIYRTRMLDDIGLFDEDFFLLYEDVDLSFRAQLRGYKCLYVPDAIVYHQASSSIGDDSPISVYYSHRNLEFVFIQNMPARLLLRTIWLHTIYNLGAFVYFTAAGQAKAFLKAKGDVLKGLNKSLKKRRQIQRNSRVDWHIILKLLEKERFYPRLARRLKKN